VERYSVTAKILVADYRGKLELERYVTEDGESVIMMSQTPVQAFSITLSPAEARQMAALLMDYADEQDAAEAS
jgi:hypothetical protein